MTVDVAALLARSERRAALAVLGVRALEYAGEDPTAPLLPVRGLDCWESGPRAAGKPAKRTLRTATWHRGSEIYGFANLSAGRRRIELTDPQRRFLPAAIVVDVPAWEPRLRALETGDEPPAAAVPIYRTVLLRPTVERGAPNGNTVLWGLVADRNGPSPWARVEITTLDDTLLYRTYADRSGVYTAWLRRPPVDPPAGGPADETGASEDEGVSDTADDDSAAGPPPEPPRATLKLRAWPLAEPPGDLDAPPADFDALAAAGELTRLYRPLQLTPGPVSSTVVLGRRTRIDLRSDL